MFAKMNKILSNLNDCWEDDYNRSPFVHIGMRMYSLYTDKDGDDVYIMEGVYAKEEKETETEETEAEIIFY